MPNPKSSARSYPSLITELEARGQFRIKPGLERMRALLATLGDPQDRRPCVHIAGTNGKGSVSASLESIFRAAGQKTGLYTSPHLIDLCERIQIGGRPISREAFCRHARRISAAERRSGVSLTYFEFVTAAAFLAFDEARIDIAILETGLGGLWDATNVVRSPLACVITSIGLDHTEWLGKTLSKIAAQKAGIIKAGVPVVSGARGAAATVIRKKARTLGSPILELRKDFDATPGVLGGRKCLQSLTYTSAHGGRAHWRTALLGRYQVENAALVLATIGVLSSQSKFRIPAGAVADGLEQVNWPGRFQTVPVSGIPVLLDGAHNPAAASAFVDAVRVTSLIRKPKTLVFSAYKDKNYAEMLKIFARLSRRIHICALPSARAARVIDLARAARRLGMIVSTASTPAQALRSAIADTPKDGAVLVTGSLALVGACLKELGFRSPSSAAAGGGSIARNIRFMGPPPMTAEDDDLRTRRGIVLHA